MSFWLCQKINLHQSSALTLLSCVAGFKYKHTFLSASSCEKSDTCLDSTNPLLPKLPFRSSPDVRQVATHPKELNNICERVQDFTFALSSSPDKPGDISGGA